MLDDILIQTLDGSVYFSEGGGAFRRLVFDRPQSGTALQTLLAQARGQAIGVATVVHGKFGNEHMHNGGSLWFLDALDKTIEQGQGSALDPPRASPLEPLR